jgi:diacylglycerol kinase family enzyme
VFAECNTGSPNVWWPRERRTSGKIRLRRLEALSEKPPVPHFAKTPPHPPRDERVSAPVKRAFIVNPIATQCPPDLGARILRAFPEARVWVTERAGDAGGLARCALTEGFAEDDLVVACGGDGTFREVAEVVGRRVHVGIVPVGTVNLVARTLGIPGEVDGALTALATGRPAEIFPGRCVLNGRPDGRPFFIAVSVGPDADADHAVGPVGKRLLGRYIYPLHLVLRLTRPVRPDVHYEADGVPGRCGQLIALRMPCYGGDYRISETASLFHPNLELVTVARGRLGVLRLFWDAARSRVTARAGIQRASVTAVHTTVPGPGRLQIDGDPFVARDLTITADAAPVRVIRG